MHIHVYMLLISPWVPLLQNVHAFTSIYSMFWSSRNPMVPVIFISYIDLSRLYFWPCFAHCWEICHQIFTHDKPLISRKIYFSTLSLVVCTCDINTLLLLSSWKKIKKGNLSSLCECQGPTSSAGRTGGPKGIPLGISKLVWFST